MLKKVWLKSNIVENAKIRYDQGTDGVSYCRKCKKKVRLGLQSI